MNDSLNSGFGPSDMDGSELFRRSNKIRSVLRLTRLINLSQERVVLYGRTKSGLDELAVRCFTFSNIFSTAIDIPGLKSELISICNGMGSHLKDAERTLTETGSSAYIELADELRQATIDTQEFLDFLRETEKKGSYEQFIVCFFILAIARGMLGGLDDIAFC